MARTWRAVPVRRVLRGSKNDEKPKLSLEVVWREARDLIWEHRGKLAIGMVLMLISRVAGLVLPYSSKTFIDDILGQGNTDLLTPLALAVAAATLVEAVTSFSLSQVISITAQRAIMNMRQRVQVQVTRLPVNYFDGTKSGELISRIMTDAEGIRNLVGTGIIQLAGSIVTAVLALAVLLHSNWQLTVAIILILALFGGLMSVAFKRLRPIFRERGKINAEVTGRLNETLGGIRVVKAYGTEAREQQVFAGGVLNLFNNVAKTITGVSAVSSFSRVIVGVAGLLVMVVGGNAVVQGDMSAGGLIRYVFFVGLLASPVFTIASISTQLSEAFAGLDRIREIMSMTTEDAEDAVRQPVTDVAGHIVFDDVTFSYEEGIPVLKGIQFEAPAGSTTALVGSSGSGKSTLVSLVMAFNRPDNGRVLVDGRDLMDLRLGDYRARLGVVLQDNFLFDGTVAENIAFARPDATREEIERVGRIAYCDPFVREFPDGYDTLVGERGVKLSGGQRQRIAIARALLADPRILILDEATSSLDSESEAMIQEGLRRLRQGRTTFVIAHRLSTIRSADQILVLEEGRIVERGTHAELMALGGRYRELHDRQYEWEEDRFVNPGEEITSPQEPLV